MINPLVMGSILKHLETDTSGIVEIATYDLLGPERGHLKHELEQVEGFEGLRIRIESLRPASATCHGGSAGSLLAGVDVLVRWIATRRDKGDRVRVEIRTKQLGKLDLSAKTPEQARAILQEAVNLLEPRRRGKSRKARSSP